jgi:hypothetical protein
MNAILTATPPTWATTSTLDAFAASLGETLIEHSRLSTRVVRQEPEGSDDPGAPVLLTLVQYQTLRDGASTLHQPFIRVDDITPGDDDPRLAATFSVAGARTLAAALLELADAAEASRPLPARTVSLGALREQLAGAR